MADLDSLPPCVKDCWELLHSEAFFLLLSNFTGLSLHFLCPADDDDDEDDGEKEKEAKAEENTEAAIEGETSSSIDKSPANTSGGKGVFICLVWRCILLIISYYLNIYLFFRAEHTRM